MAMARGRRIKSGRGPVGRLIGMAAIVLAVAAACNMPFGPSSTQSGPPEVSTGVRGLVLAGPTCPVERPDQSACVRPVEGATIVALDSGGHEAGRAVSDSTGAYFLRLPPGTYRIVPGAVEGLMGPAPEVTVTLDEGQPTQLDLRYDTGIR